MSAVVDFTQGFYNRLVSWKDFSESQCVFLTACARAMSMLESGNYSNSNATLYNNPANYTCYRGSMWQSGCTAPRQDGPDVHAFAIYNSFKDCGCEIADWVHRRAATFRYVKTVREFASALKQNGYFRSDLEDYARGMETYFDVPTGNYSDDEPSKLEGLLAKAGRPPYIFYLLGLVIVLALYYAGWSFKKLFLWRR